MYKYLGIGDVISHLYFQYACYTIAIYAFYFNIHATFSDNKYDIYVSNA